LPSRTVSFRWFQSLWLRARILDERGVEVVVEKWEQVNRLPVYYANDLGRVLAIDEDIFLVQIIVPKRRSGNDGIIGKESIIDAEVRFNRGRFLAALG
jgi:hypothetical protein